MVQGPLTKYEDVYLKGYADGREAARGISEWIAFYNERRPHQALGHRAPMTVRRDAVAVAKAVDRMDNACAMPTAAEPDAASRCVIERNDERSDFQRTTIQAVPLRGSISSILDQ